jgi:hypothetical protein
MASSCCAGCMVGLGGGDAPRSPASLLPGKPGHPAARRARPPPHCRPASPATRSPWPPRPPAVRQPGHPCCAKRSRPLPAAPPDGHLPPCRSATLPAVQQPAISPAWQPQPCGSWGTAVRLLRRCEVCPRRLAIRRLQPERRSWSTAARGLTAMLQRFARTASTPPDHTATSAPTTAQRRSWSTTMRGGPTREPTGWLGPSARCLHRGVASPWRICRCPAWTTTLALARRGAMDARSRPRRPEDYRTRLLPVGWHRALPPITAWLHGLSRGAGRLGRCGWRGRPPAHRLRWSRPLLELAGQRQRVTPGPLDRCPDLAFRVVAGRLRVVDDRALVALPEIAAACRVGSMRPGVRLRGGLLVRVPGRRSTC